MSTSECLVRVHPATGGKTRDGRDQLNFAGQAFRGVSPDVFFELERDGAADCRRIIRKLNAAVQVSPRLYSVDNFIEDFCRGPIESTDKSKYHGDHRSGLLASQTLLALISNFFPKKGFTVEGRTYRYHSIGLAMNPGYKAVDHRAGNPFDNHSSHFEIKFIETREGPGPFTAEHPELLCLNIHFLAAQSGSFGAKAVKDRLQALIGLFSQELALRKGPRDTYLLEAMGLTLSNYEEKGFSIKHHASVAAKEKYDLAEAYDAKKLKKRTLFDFLPKALTGSSEEKSSASAELLVPTGKPSVWNTAAPLAAKLGAPSSVGGKGTPPTGPHFG
jgi:hypothetical protein